MTTRKCLVRTACALLIAVCCSRAEVRTGGKVDFGSVDDYFGWADEAGWQQARTSRDPDFELEVSSLLCRNDILNPPHGKRPQLEWYYPQVRLHADRRGRVVWVSALFLKKQRSAITSMLQSSCPEIRRALEKLLEEVEKEGRVRLVEKGMDAEAEVDVSSGVVSLDVCIESIRAKRRRSRR